MILSQGRIKQCPLVFEREEEKQEWNEQKLPKAVYSGGRLPRRSAKE